MGLNSFVIKKNNDNFIFPFGRTNTNLYESGSENYYR